MAAVDKKFSSIGLALTKLLREGGEFLKLVGETEKDDPDYFKFVNEMRENPTAMKDFIEKAPKKYSTEFMGLVMRIGFVISAIKDADKNHEIKINSGKELISIGDDLEKLIKKIDEEENVPAK